MDRIEMNIIMNVIILFIHGVDIGIAKIITIPMSKMINKIITHKTENSQTAAVKTGLQAHMTESSAD